MAVELKELLKRLCVEFGWSYAGFWNLIDFPNSRHLICEDVYYERKEQKEVGRPSCSQSSPLIELGCDPLDTLSVLVNMMVSTVQIVGYGLIGEAAATGNPRWIFHDTHSGVGSVAKGFTEMHDQLVAGIQTIVIIPVLPLGVVQLGSTQTVVENIIFVDHVKFLFMQQHFGSGAPASDAAREVLDIKGRICPSADMLISSNQIEDAFKIDTHMAISTSGCNPELKEPSFSGSSADPWSLVSSRFQENMPPSTSELTSNKQLLKVSYPVGIPVLHLNRQVLNQLLAGQALNSKQDIGSMQGLPQRDTDENQLFDGVSVISCSNSKFLEQQLLLTSQTETRKTTRNSSPSVSDSRIASIVTSSALANRETCLGNTCYRTGEHMNPLKSLPALEIPGMPYQNFNSYDTLNISKICKGSQPLLINKGFRTSSVGTSNDVYDFIQTSSVVNFEPHSDSSLLCDGQKLLCRSNPVLGDQQYRSTVIEGSDTCLGLSSQNVEINNDCKPTEKLDNNASLLSTNVTARDSDLFDVIGLDYKGKYTSQIVADALVNNNPANFCTVNKDTSLCQQHFDCHSDFSSLDADASSSGVSSITAGDQLLDAVIPKINLRANHSLVDDAPCDTSFATTFGSHYIDSRNHDEVAIPTDMQYKAFGVFPVLIKTEKSCSSYTKSSCSSEKVEKYAPNAVFSTPDIGRGVENSQKNSCDAMSASNGKKFVKDCKLNKKRLRPGENPRPRPKDRQMIQDRIKELREIVPNGTKCSIDALLEKTIRHMIFLQCVTKHANKLKDTGEPKISDMDNCLHLKDKFDGGATWAFEVDSQSMVYPIIVEDLNSPRQMLVEMLCEDRGFFLEIADFIRGLGLTILKGVMEARKNKIWARFAVEANRDMTRMEIFLALVKLLEPGAGSNLLANVANSNARYYQPSIPATGLSDCFQ